jgi:hypothetical protein
MMKQREEALMAELRALQLPNDLLRMAEVIGPVEFRRIWGEVDRINAAAALADVPPRA